MRPTDNDPRKRLAFEGRDAQAQTVRDIAAKLQPMRPARFRTIRHPVTGAWVELR